MATNEGVKGATTRLSEETQAARKSWLADWVDLLASQFFHDCAYWQPSGSPLAVAMKSLEKRGIRSALVQRCRLVETTLATSFSANIPNVSTNYSVFMGMYSRTGENVSKMTPEFIQKISEAQNVDEYVALIRDNLMHSYRHTNTGDSFLASLEEAIKDNYNNLDDVQRSTEFFLNKVAYYHFPCVEWDVAANRPVISYYNSEANFIRGIRTKTRAGRYMKMVCPDIPEHFLQYLIGGPWDQTPLPLKITDDPDEIERVYTNGPRSCMSYSTDEYRSSMHPVRVYGNSPDLVLAYIEREGRITARTLMRRDMTGFSTTYGDATRLRQAMITAGMSEDVAKHGGDNIYKCHIRRVKDDCYPHLNIVPYIDNYSLREVVLEGKKMYRIVTRGDGHHYGDTTNGLTGDPEEDLNYCEFHEEYTSEDVHEVIVGWRRTTSNRAHYVTACWSDRAVSRHATWSEYYDYYVSNNLEFSSTSIGIMCHDDPDFADMVECCETGEYVHLDDATQFGDPDNGEFISDSVLYSRDLTFGICDETGTANRRYDMIDYQGKTVAKWWVEQNDPDFFTNNDNDDTSQKEAA